MTNLVSRWMVLAVVVLAVTSLLGHVLGIEVLSRGLEDLPAMSVHTATSMLLLATALWRERVRPVAAGLAAASGLFALFVEAFTLQGAAGWVSSPGTGTMVLLLAGSLLFRRLTFLAGVVGAAAIGIVVALLMDFRALYAPAGIVADSGISLPTATAAAALAAAWLVRDLDLRDPSVRRLLGWSTRSLVGVIGVLAVGRLLEIDRTPIAATAVMVAAVGPVVAAWRTVRTEQEAMRAVGDVRALLMQLQAVGVVLVDEAGRIVEASGAAGDMLESRPEELVGQAVDRFVPPELREQHVVHRQGYADRRERLDMARRGTLEFVTATGERRMARIGLARITEPGGRRLFAVTMIDVTALTRQAEQATAQAESLRETLWLQTEAAQRVRQLDETKSLLLEAVSHELRTPMAAVLGLSELLAGPRGASDLATDQDLRQRLRRQARTLHRRLSALLDLSPAGQLRPARPEPIGLPDLVGVVVAEVEAEEGRPVGVAVPAVGVSVDVLQFRRLLDGLLMNACRHAGDGAIEVVGAVIDGEVLLAIEDQGPGIPVERREEIFEPFSGGDGPSEAGVGVGLALVRRLAELNGLRIWVEDAPGGGARFVVTLPVVEPQDSARAEVGRDRPTTWKADS